MLTRRLVQASALVRPCSTVASPSSSTVTEDKPQVNVLERFLDDKIKVSGPISVAEYMKTAVSSSSVGYYGKHSDENKRGDFITAPELTQLFGEMVGIWIYYELANTGYRGPWNLVECGPGTGQLSSDLLRVMDRFQEKDMSLHLVETSEALIDAQEKLLCGEKTSNTVTGKDGWIRANRTASGVPVYWYHNVDDLPDGFSVFVANELLDALPVHCFERGEGPGGKWHERMITRYFRYIGLDGKGRLRFVRSKGENIHTMGLIPRSIRDDPSRSVWECSPEAGTFVHQVADRLTTFGGFALLVDYGHDGSRRTPSFRAYSKHQQVDPLSAPGAIDLTADVDFGYLRGLLLGGSAGGKDGGEGTVSKEGGEEEEGEAGGTGVVVYGPQTQREFLGQLGIEVRLRRLLKECTDRQKQEEMIKSYNMLMGDMGERFQAMAVFPRTLQAIIRKRGGSPAGFNGAPGAEVVAVQGEETGEEKKD